MDLKEARIRGTLTVYTDTDPELEREVKEYNKMMSDCRFKMKRVRELEFAYFILDIVVVVGLMIIDPYTTNYHQLSEIVSAAVLIIFAAAFLYFTVIKKNLVIPTAVSVLLLLLDIRFAILTAADVILAVWHTMALSRLKKVDGYPTFSDITVKYERFPENGSHM
ncbi:MAG: hypothetical protein K2N38_06865 [Oscillospiraceae bacterium]|nr:hypothetical protein [Oscillospiraceae bacterium]